VAIQATAQEALAVPSDSLLSERRKFDCFFLEALRMKANERHNDTYNLLLHALEIDSTSSSALYEIANYYLFLGQTDLAFHALQKAAEYSPHNFEYRIALASLARELDNHDEEAVAMYESLVADYPDKPELNYYLSELYVRRKEPEKAIQALNVLEQNIGMSESLTLQKFRLYSQLNQRERAFNEVKRLADQFPYESRYRIILGDLYLEQNETDTALVYFRKAHEIDPENPYYIVSMANYYEHIGDNKAASEEIDAALRNPKLEVDTKLGILSRYIQTLQLNKKEMDAANTLFETLMDQHSQEKGLNLMYGQFLLMQGKTEEAKFRFQVVTESIPENSEAWKQLIGIALRANDADECIKICNQALEHFPEMPDFYFYKGAGYYQKKEYLTALETYQQGLQFVTEDELPYKSDFFGQIGDLYHHLNRNQEAYQAYDSALFYNERNVVVLNNYAYFLALDKHDLSKAERMSNQCIKLQPDNSTYLDTYAWVFFVQGNYTLAKFYIERAMSVDSDKSAEIIEHYGDILFMTGDVDNAVAQWTIALEKKKSEADADTAVLERKIAERKYLES